MIMVYLHLYDFDRYGQLHDCNITIYVEGGWISGSV
jgi:hypothetical protein